MTPPLPDLPRRALSAYLGPAALDEGAVAVEPLGEGLIHETYHVIERQAPGAGWVLQRVNPIFGIAVHEDIEAVTRHLERKGLPTPLLRRARDGALSVQLEGAVFRLMDFVPGETHSVMRPALCREAGRLVGRFHGALRDLRHEFRFVRPGAHDLRRHLATLAAARAAAKGRAGTDPAFFPLAEEVLDRGAALPAEVPGPLRVCHGDLKLNNLRFEPAGAGLCLLDLDTMGRMPLCIEIGDALRSWCNPCAEDDAGARFDLDLFRLAIEGYAEAAGDMLTGEEWGALPAGAGRIALELSARFLADVVHDAYFRYDPRRYESRPAHNLARARGQLALSKSAAAQEAAADAAVAAIRARRLPPSP